MYFCTVNLLLNAVLPALLPYTGAVFRRRRHICTGPIWRIILLLWSHRSLWYFLAVIHNFSTSFINCSYSNSLNVASRSPKLTPSDYFYAILFSWCYTCYAIFNWFVLKMPHNWFRHWNVHTNELISAFTSAKMCIQACNCVATRSRNQYLCKYRRYVDYARNTNLNVTVLAADAVRFPFTAVAYWTVLSFFCGNFMAADICSQFIFDILGHLFFTLPKSYVKSFYVCLYVCIRLAVC